MRRCLITGERPVQEWPVAIMSGSSFRQSWVRVPSLSLDQLVSPRASDFTPLRLSLHM